MQGLLGIFVGRAERLWNGMGLATMLNRVHHLGDWQHLIVVEVVLRQSKSLATMLSRGQRLRNGRRLTIIKVVRFIPERILAIVEVLVTIYMPEIS